MAKVVKFTSPAPEKLGPQRARKRKCVDLEKRGQLNLFTGGKVISLNRLSCFEEALMYDDRGDINAAKEKYKKAIDKSDCVADAYCNLGILESQEGNVAKAIDCFTLCLKQDPRHYEAHYNLANIYSEVGNLSLAKFHYEVSIELEPSFCNNYFNLGLTLAINKEFKEALMALRRYRELTPGEEHRQTDDLINQLKGCDLTTT
jgi:tetratricopeptide (TPR) repeat protein